MTEKIREKIDQNRELVPMSIKEVSVYTNLTVKYLYKLVHYKKIPVHRSAIGSKLRFEKSEIDEWMFSRTQLTWAQIEESMKASNFVNLPKNKKK
ncbi:hypothetical protein CJD36_012545 [Flavipsychrobacter stenotrophus]|uniref:Helix-turn-helix domain-containing protein n=1 Tax=Flavipsychrobacter stenotrophus TaxID=2077091 RepID=A0A2S7SV28_9BACT|nr:excisionase family DNA-binding protein [Flavipsychrobacter stenotrophus]PQJ10792.1 hypothetical protein CJD36_012545 [Flavipsychrobacter stenotrophus]